MTFVIEKYWKSFNISLPKLKEEILNITLKLDGLAVGGKDLLWIVFSEPLTEEELQQINDLWDSIDENHPIATSYKSQAQIEQEEAQRREQRQNAINAIKQGALTKSWDEMSVLERKVAMNMEVSDEELGLN